GCNRRAAGTDLDRIVAFDGSNTVAANLQPLCSRHHHLKHEAGWRVQRRCDGTTEWTSPTGRRYEKPPDPWPQ
ncbi:MAG: HNH endonuclease signature motif containing protein, partial [Jatrophihabitantaceae bacterium]